MSEAIHPIMTALTEPKIRTDYLVEMALAEAARHGALFVDRDLVEIWMYDSADVDESTAVLEAAHDALHDPQAWAGWRELEDGAWLLYFAVEAAAA